MENTFIKSFNEIRALTNISSSEKDTLELLISLAKKKGYAYPSNEKLAEELQCSTSTVQRILAKLKKFNYIYTRFEKHRTMDRQIHICDQYQHLIMTTPSLQDNEPSKRSLAASKRAARQMNELNEFREYHDDLKQLKSKYELQG